MKKATFVSFLFFSLNAVLHSESPITPENIAEKSEKMPPALQEMVDEFNRRHPDLLTSIIPITENVAITKEQIEDELVRSMQILIKEKISVSERTMRVNEKLKIKIPRNSYVIALSEVEGKIYTIVVAGPYHKIHQLESYNGKGYWKPLDPEKDKKSPTYQTVNQAFHALKCKEVVKEKGLTTFECPEVYLAQVPGRSDMYEHASDENTFIVRRYYDYQNQWVALQTNLKYVARLSPKTIKDLYEVTKNAGLHFLADDGNLMISKDTYHLMMRDVQGPNDQNPDHPFNGQEPFKKEFSKSSTNIKKYAEDKKWHSFKCALCGFTEKILKEAEEEGFPVQDQWEVLRNKVVNDKDVDNIDKNLRKELYECVRHKN